MIGGMASGCPLNNLIPEWNDLVYKGRWREAIDRLLVGAALCDLAVIGYQARQIGRDGRGRRRVSGGVRARRRIGAAGEGECQYPGGERGEDLCHLRHSNLGPRDLISNLPSAAGSTSPWTNGSSTHASGP